MSITFKNRKPKTFIYQDDLKLISYFEVNNEHDYILVPQHVPHIVKF